jgi:hypothetical protein
MKKYLPSILTILIIACNDTSDKKLSDEQISLNTDSIKTVNNQEQVRLPKSEFEIAEGGIGKLLLGDSFSSVDKKFPKFDTLTMNSEGLDWPAKRIDLGSGEWILVESNDGGELITRLHTNSKKYKTIKGFYIGQTFDEVVKSGEEIGVDIDEGLMSIRLYGEKVSISVDSLSEKHFYNSKNQDINDIPKNAKIVEFGIF